jgi:aconitase A
MPGLGGPSHTGLLEKELEVKVAKVVLEAKEELEVQVALVVMAQEMAQHFRKPHRTSPLVPASTHKHFHCCHQLALRRQTASPGLAPYQYQKWQIQTGADHLLARQSCYSSQSAHS